MAADVFFLPVPASDPSQDGLEMPLDIDDGLTTLVQALLNDEKVGTSQYLGLKTHFGKPNRQGTIRLRWHEIVAEVMAQGKPWGIFDTLSITTKGLENTESFRETAIQKGMPDCEIADDPALGAGTAGHVLQNSTLCSVTCAAGLKKYDSLGVLNTVRPHPFLGMLGAIPALGLGLVDRKTKLLLHEDLRPKVNTPLCAGCGSCLDVCIFDAIEINGGRATIDHSLCTGCAECMDSCFMAGIDTEKFGQVDLFQQKVADAALAVVACRSEKVACFNFLLRLNRSTGGSFSGKRVHNLGVLASWDPVALDQATWDLLIHQLGANLAVWSGFPHDPEVMLARAAEVGLGSRQYDLTEVLPKK